MGLLLAGGFLALSRLQFSRVFHLSQKSAPPSATLRLPDLFLEQRLRAEYYLQRRTPDALDAFLQKSDEFSASLERAATEAISPEGKALVRRIRTLFARYANGVVATGTQLEMWKKEHVELGERIVAALLELIRQGKSHAGATMTDLAGKNIFSEAAVPCGLALGAVGGIALLLSLYARWERQPLRSLAHEMQRVYLRKPRRALRIYGSKEITEAAHAFNLMIERLEGLDKMQADSLAQMSHELRTSLSAVQEGVDLLLEGAAGSLTAPQHDIAQVMRNNSERLSRRLVSILDLSKMEANKMDYAFVPGDLTTLLQQSVETILPLAQKKHLEIQWHAPMPLPLVYVDEDRLRQVLDNLLYNAVQFTPEKGLIRVSTVVWYDRDSGDSWIEVSVSDTGVRVPQEEAEQIFHKFYQSVRGSSLGFTIARHIVEAHGGRIWVESHSQEGATFIFTLSVRRPDDTKRPAKVLPPKKLNASSLSQKL